MMLPVVPMGRDHDFHLVPHMQDHTEYEHATVVSTVPTAIATPASMDCYHILLSTALNREFTGEEQFWGSVLNFDNASNSGIIILHCNLAPKAMHQ